MSIPLDRLYHYIESVARDVYGDTLIYRFYPHGSKKLEDLNCINPHGSYENAYFPQIICYDQEPLNYDLYKDAPVALTDEIKSIIDVNLLPKRNIRTKLGNIYDKCILLHSEQNSPELEKYQNDQFIPVYYWSHAIISRDWYRYANHITIKKNPKKTFLIYNRAWSGTREYRLKFADLLIKHNLLDDCQTSMSFIDNGQHYQSYKFINPAWVPIHQLEKYFSENTTTSCYSADFNINDYQSTNIEIVLETLFDDSRWHLTEKILRPIVCGHPFILASTPGALTYLKNYGFKTFDKIFNESYDQITDPQDRLQSIVQTMKEITSWNPDKQRKNMEEIYKIAEYNKQHFFSDKFNDLIVNELKENLANALQELEATNTSRQFLQTHQLFSRIPEFLQARKESKQNEELRKIRIESLAKARSIRNKWIKKSQ